MFGGYDVRISDGFSGLDHAPLTRRRYESAEEEHLSREVADGVQCCIIEGLPLSSAVSLLLAHCWLSNKPSLLVIDRSIDQPGAWERRGSKAVDSEDTQSAMKHLTTMRIDSCFQLSNCRMIR